MNNKNIKINPILVKKSKKPSNIKLKIIGNNLNNLSKNKNVKFIKPKQNNIQISPNYSKLKSYSKIFKKSINISHQNLENYHRQVKSNKSHFKKDYIEIQNLSPNFGNNIEGKINKIKIMNIHSNIKKENNINSNNIITNKIPRIGDNATFNNIQKRVYIYKNLRHKTIKKDNNFTLPKNSNYISVMSKSKNIDRTINGTFINNNNTISNTINSNNTNKPIISIYNNYSINTRSSRNGCFNLDFDLNNINNNKIKNNNNYYSSHGYKISNINC